jgi:hypothetical protein
MTPRERHRDPGHAASSALGDARGSLVPARIHDAPFRLLQLDLVPTGEAAGVDVIDGPSRASFRRTGPAVWVKDRERGGVRRNRTLVSPGPDDDRLQFATDDEARVKEPVARTPLD